MKYTHEQWTCQSQLDTAARGVSLSLQPSWGGGGGVGVLLQVSGLSSAASRDPLGSSWSFQVSRPDKSSSR